MKLFFCAVFVWPLWILELRFVRSVPNLPCHAISGWWLQCNSCLWCLLPPKQRICWYCQLFPHKSKCIQMSRRPTREHWKNFQVLAMTMMPEITIYISFRKWSGWGRGWCSTGVKRIFTCLVQNTEYSSLVSMYVLNDTHILIAHILIALWQFMLLQIKTIYFRLCDCKKNLNKHFNNNGCFQVGTTPRKLCLAAEGSCWGESQSYSLSTSIQISHSLMLAKVSFCKLWICFLSSIAVEIFLHQGNSSLANVTLNAGGQSLR